MNKKNNIIIYQAKDGKVELRADIDKDTIWANINQIAVLFNVQKAAISKHLKNIFKSGELIKKSTVSKMETVQIENGRSTKRQIEFYNLDAIIAVGYRVNSKKATQFRIWATGVLREYLKNGYILEENKLKKKPELIEGLQESLALIASNKIKGKLKGRITLKLQKI